MASSLRTPQDHRLVVSAYLEKRQLYPFQVAAPVPEDLGMVVVIPCLAEPDLLATLDSLAQCSKPQCAVEVLVVINHAEDAQPQVVADNRAALLQAQAWVVERQPFWHLHLLDFPGLPERSAGVGLARKLGLDEAVARLALSTTGEGLLVCLDADCAVADNYLQAIEAHYRSHPATGAATIDFEHPLDGPPDNGLAIAQYELHLRYYVEALRWAGVPGVRHTVGSCISLRSTVYAREGGMNRRQAGEDYYFLQKLVAAVKVDEIHGTRVYPSARQSWRVPFGTGRAIADNAGLDLRSYDPEIFADLAQWLELAPQLYDAERESAPDDLPPILGQWLRDQDVSARLQEIRRNTGTPGSFRRRLFRWFNAFRCLKFVHHATAQGRPRIPVERAAMQLLNWLRDDHGITDQDTMALLLRYRQRQQESLPGADG